MISPAGLAPTGLRSVMRRILWNSIGGLQRLLGLLTAVSHSGSTAFNRRTWLEWTMTHAASTASGWVPSAGLIRVRRARIISMHLNRADRPLLVLHPDEPVSFPSNQNLLTGDFQESRIHPVEADQKIICDI